MDVINFVKRCKYFILCSADGNYPAARPFGAILKHGDYFYISASPAKEVYNQIKNNEYIQIVAVESDTRKWIRITGRAYESENLRIKKIMLNENPILLKHFNSEKSKDFILFQINPLKIELKQGDTVIMERRIFNKLVRDKIPELLDKNGGETETEVLDSKKYIACLFNKLKEECEEVITADSKENLAEELADLLEVMQAISNAYNVDFDKIEKIRLNKKEKRGGFERKIFLKSSNVVNKI